MTTELQAERRAWIEAVVASDVTSATRIGAGASRASWLVELADGRSVVLREETGSGPMVGTALDLGREAAVYVALRSEDVPLPALLAASSDGEAMVLERACGEASLKSLDSTQVGTISTDLGQILARLHAVDPARLELGPVAVPSDGPDHALQDLGLWASIQQSRVIEPVTRVVDVALAWLAAHAPDRPARTSVCHGDAGAGNFLHEGGRVTALLDWEFAHVGDPHDDLAWVAVRNEVLRHPLDVGAVYRAWQATLDLDVQPATLEYYRALVLTRMLISCDAAISWAKDEPPVVQTMLRPYLGLAVVEALRRAGHEASALGGIEADARARWADAPIATMLGDPAGLIDLGGPW